MEFTCKNCGQTYAKSPSRMGRSRYCSRKCLADARRLATVPCLECGQPAKPDRKSRPRKFCCRECSNKYVARNRPNTKGWTITSRGYRMVMAKDHPAASKDGYVLEHRLMMEKTVGRRLARHEVVHHKNGDRLDNRPENLELMTKADHDKLDKGRRRPGMIVCPHCQEAIHLTSRARIVKAR